MNCLFLELLQPTPLTESPLKAVKVYSCGRAHRSQAIQGFPLRLALPRSRAVIPPKVLLAADWDLGNTINPRAEECSRRLRAPMPTIGEDLSLPLRYQERRPDMEPRR